MVELQRIRWYNPKDGSFEWRDVPKSDEEAISLLSSSPYTQSCTYTYWYWRKLDATITAALLRVGEQAKGERN
jgi:hypothetical protein